MSKINPKSILLPYQRLWADDAARFKIGLMARQTGKSFCSAAEIVEDSLLNPKSMWVILSAGERQALEYMRKVKEWAEAYKVVVKNTSEIRDSAEALIRSAEIEWKNGSRILAVPANADTARGYSANLLLDEFAFHEAPDEIWRAIYPSISNPLRGQKKIRIISTANGKANKFYDLWSKDNGYSKHLVTIYDAVKQGLGLDVEELRKGLDDPEGWAQEYECQFIDTAAILLPYDLIALCEHVDATETCGPEYFASQGAGRRVTGIDFGRKKDLTVAWTLEEVGDVWWTREVLVLSAMSTPDQVAILRPRLAGVSRACLDYQGAGVGLGDYLAAEFGEYKPDDHKFGRVELCNFTNSLKQEIYPRMRMKFEERKLRIPQSRNIREDLHAVQRVTTPGGLVTYKAPHTEDGHSDRSAALALAIKAASAQTSGVITSVDGIHIPTPKFQPRRLG